MLWRRRSGPNGFRSMRIGFGPCDSQNFARFGARSSNLSLPRGRSLADFAKLVEIFDAKSVSFVAVTQQFNTTTSMGRLTLNVLLSFAQFERELASERVRDKIAASRKKGKWTGGSVPLGYDNKDKRLLIKAVEAKTVRMIFERYLALKSFQ